jgi:hypothetical protein
MATASISVGATVVDVLKWIGRLVLGSLAVALAVTMALVAGSYIYAKITYVPAHIPPDIPKYESPVTFPPLPTTPNTFPTPRPFVPVDRSPIVAMDFKMGMNALIRGQLNPVGLSVIDPDGIKVGNVKEFVKNANASSSAYVIEYYGYGTNTITTVPIKSAKILLEQKKPYAIKLNAPLSDFIPK